MYAVVQTGGKQYRVSAGDVITVEKLSAEAGSVIALEDVLAVGTEAGLKIGTPVVEGAEVKAEVLGNGKAKKVIIFKYKAKKHSKKKQGHRQPFTALKITSISVDGQTEAAPAEAKEEVKAEKVNLKSMKKAELAAYAEAHNIELPAKATNAEMIAAIEAAEK